jgi:hypothetical protein
MSGQQQEDKLWLMLGEIRSDIKHLLQERSHTNQRLDEHVNHVATKLEDQENRVRKLENFRIKIAALATVLGVFVPLIISLIGKKLGV